MFRKGRTGGLGALMASMCQEGSNVYMRGKIKDGMIFGWLHMHSEEALQSLLVEA